MKIAVTGANGYIGSHLVKVLLDTGCRVTAVDLNFNSTDSRAILYTENIFNEKINFYEEWDIP